MPSGCGSNCTRLFGRFKKYNICHNVDADKQKYMKHKFLRALSCIKKRIITKNTWNSAIIAKSSWFLYLNLTICQKDYKSKLKNKRNMMQCLACILERPNCLPVVANTL